MQRIPYTLVVGEQEQSSGSVNVRVRGGETLGNMSMAQLMERLAHEVATKGNV